MSLVKCQDCGAQVSSTAKKCPQCGKDLSAVSPRGCGCMLSLLAMIVGLLGGISAAYQGENPVWWFVVAGVGVVVGILLYKADPTGTE